MELDQSNWEQEVNNYPGPILVYFWAGAHAPSHQMMPMVDALAHDYRVGKVEVNVNNELARTYDVFSAPTFIFFKAGVEVKRLIGSQWERTLRSEVEKLS